MTASKRVSKPAPKSAPKPEPALSLHTYVDLSKLRKASLKRYKKHFKLHVKADSKTELLDAVGRHFAQMPVSEADVAREFNSFWRLKAGRRVAAHASTLAAAAVSVGAASAAAPPAAGTHAASAAGR